MPVLPVLFLACSVSGLKSDGLKLGCFVGIVASNSIKDGTQLEEKRISCV